MPRLTSLLLLRPILGPRSGVRVENFFMKCEWCDWLFDQVFSMSMRKLNCGCTCMTVAVAVVVVVEVLFWV